MSCATGLKGLQGCVALQNLQLQHNQLTPAAPAAVDSLCLGHLSQLETLRVDSNPSLGADGIRQLSLERLPYLTELNASALGLELAGARAHNLFFCPWA